MLVTLATRTRRRSYYTIERERNKGLLKLYFLNLAKMPLINNDAA